MRRGFRNTVRAYPGSLGVSTEKGYQDVKPLPLESPTESYPIMLTRYNTGVFEVGAEAPLPDPSPPIDEGIMATWFLGGDGDIGAATNRAISYWLNTGTDKPIIIPPSPSGAWDIRSPMRLPPSLTRTLKILGVSGTRLQTTATGSRLFDLDKTEDNQNFDNYEIGNFEVDASKSVGFSHLLVGSRINNAFIGRFNAENWVFRDITLRNIPNFPSFTPASNLSVVFLSPFHVTNDEAVQNRVENIRFENVTAYGGNGGFQVNGFNGGSIRSANIYFDNIQFVNCRHYLPFSGAQYVVSNFHIGGYGEGDRLLMQDCEGSNSGDNFIEINAMRRGTLSGISADSPYVYGLYVNNFKPIPSNEQVINVEDISLNLGLASGRGVSFGQESLVSNRTGSVYLDGVKVNVPRGALWAANGKAINAYPNGAGSKSIDLLSVKNLEFTADVNGTTIASTYTPAVINVKLDGASNVQIENVSVNIAGTVSITGSPVVFPRAIHFENNSDCSLDASNISVNVSANFPDFWAVYIQGASAGLNGSIDGLSFTSTSVAKTLFRVQGTPLDASHTVTATNLSWQGTKAFFSVPAQSAYLIFP